MKKMMKRRGIFFLTVSVLLCLITGCGNDNTAVQNKSIENGVSSEIEKENKKEKAEQFISDYKPEQKNVDGISQANWINGGWITEQGDWNYYCIDHVISKENVLTGEKKVIYQDNNINYISVCGDYIYTLVYEGDRNGSLCRIKTDGSCFQKSSQIICYGDYWGVSKDKTYVIIRENISAQTVTHKLMLLDWNTDELTEIYDFGYLVSDGGGMFEEGTYFDGFEDGYFYYHQLNCSNSDFKSIYTLYKINLDNIEEKYKTTVECQDCWYAQNIIIREGVIYLFTKEYWRSCDIKEGINTIGIYDKNDSSIFINGDLGDLIEKSAANFIDDNLILTGQYKNEGIGGEKIYGFRGMENPYVVTNDSTYYLLTAHGKIYYYANDMFCRINPDGSSWEQLQ